MHIKLRSQFSSLVNALVEDFKHTGFTVSSNVTHHPVEVCELKYGSSFTLIDLAPILEILDPISPKLVHSQKIDHDHILISLGSERAFKRWEVRVYGDSELKFDFSDTLLEYGFSYGGVQTHLGTQGRLVYGGADSFSRQLIRWLAARVGVHLIEERRWDTDILDFHVFLPDPTLKGEILKEKTPILLEGRELEDLIQFKTLLYDRGYQKVNICVVDSEPRTAFSISGGRFLRDPELFDELKQLTKEYLSTFELDEDLFSLVDLSTDQELEAHIYLPLDLYRAGTLRPVDGQLKAYWDLVIFTDDQEKIQPLIHQINLCGFSNIKIEKITGDVPLFVDVCWSTNCEESYMDEICTPLLDAVRLGVSEIEISGIRSDLPIQSSQKKLLKSEIEIYVPICYLSGPKLEDRLKKMCSEWEMSIKTERISDIEPLVKQIKSLEFKSFDTESDESYDSAFIQYGGAPLILIQYIASIIKEQTGLTCRFDKEWGDADDDIWIKLPPVKVTQVNEFIFTDTQQSNINEWFIDGPVSAAKEISFIEIKTDSVRIADLILPRQQGDPHPMTPRVEEFQHYCIDQRTAESLYHVAEAVILREPCLLEGETSVSKTSIIQYLAMLLNQPVIRLNLNGQTDTGELIGRFLPQGSLDELPISVDDLLSSSSLLSEQTQKILSSAEQEGRTLNLVEVQKVIASEQMPRRSWRWQDGMIIEAMRHGWWIILDELNLAEPQILERLNSLLERTPSLVLTEHNNQVMGPNGQPIHQQFRIFATMNPAEYAGRSPLSPAYRDRWSGYRYVTRPLETDYYAMLHYLVFGEQPKINIFGREYVGLKNDLPPFAHLAHFSKFDLFLQVLARFHCALEKAVDPQASGVRMGGRRKEGYIFTRRGLLSVMNYIASDLHPQRNQKTRVYDMRTALCRYYINRVTTAADREVILQLLDAVGLGLQTWSV